MIQVLNQKIYAGESVSLSSDMYVLLFEYYDGKPIYVYMYEKPQPFDKTRSRNRESNLYHYTSKVVLAQVVLRSLTLHGNKAIQNTFDSTECQLVIVSHLHLYMTLFGERWF